MDRTQPYEAFLNELRKKIPQNPLLVNTLVELLCVEKEAVYRRLRKDVPFTFQEIALIAKHLGISLDGIVGIASRQNISFQLLLAEFTEAEDIDISLLQNYTTFIESLKTCKNTETAMVTNMLPQPFFSGFDYLRRYFVFSRHFHFHHNVDKSPPAFHELSLSPKITDYFEWQFKSFQKIDTGYYVFDRFVFQRFVNNADYFHSIRLIKKEDILKIKEELFQLLDFLENICITGEYKDTKKKVYLYISDIDVTTNYAYIDAGNHKFSMMKTFLLSSSTSINESVFEKLKNCIASLVKVSTLITIANEKQRILYFEKQRRIVDEL